MSLIKDYASEVFGSSVYAYWLYVYTAYNQKFVEGWIPDNYFGHIVVPVINKEIRQLAAKKTLSRKIIGGDLFPDKFYFIDNTWYDIDFNVIDAARVQKLMSDLQYEFYLKEDDSAQGKGVFKVNKNSFNLKDFPTYKNFVIQEAIKQAEWFDKIITGSVATIRITTVKGTDSSIKMRASYLRVGRSNSQIIQSSTAIKVPIIDGHGGLGDFGASPSWKRHLRHPDSGFEFAGQKVPHFTKVVSECEKLHAKMPHFSIIGWDASINDRGDVRIMEWNAGHTDIKFSEASTGPCFSDLNWEKLWKN